MLNFESGIIKEIVPYTTHNLGTPVSDGRFVYFVAPYSGIDNIYAFDIDKKKIFQVSSRKFGAYNPSISPDRKKLAFNDVTETGYNAVEMDINPAEWVPLEKVADRSVKYYEPLIAQEAGGNILKNIPEKEYEIKDYSHILHIFNVHSWMPYADTYGKDFSVTLWSTNLLTTVDSYLTYIYNWNEKTHFGMGGISYSGLFPVLNLSVQYGGRAAYIKDSNKKNEYYKWNEASPGLGITVPFNLSRDRYTTGFAFGINFEYIKTSGLDEIYEKYQSLANTTFFPITYFMSFSRSFIWFGDIYPRWGQVLNLSYSHTPFKSETKASQVAINGTFYFPGIFKNNSFFLKGGYEHQDMDEYVYKSRMLFARGYKAVIGENIYKGCANYTFPIYNPDLNILHVLHLKRFFANGFYDYLTIIDSGNKYYFRSSGASL